MCKTCVIARKMGMENFEENGVVLEGADKFKYLVYVLNNGGECTDVQ